MMIDQVKLRLVAAMKEKNEIAKNILRVALGELQMGEVRTARALTDEEARAVFRKLVKSNEETLALAGDGDSAAMLRAENAILLSLLPTTLSVDDIVATLVEQREAIRAAGNDGQATGIAMKHLKVAGAVVSGQDVAAAVKRMRA